MSPRSLRVDPTDVGERVSLRVRHRVPGEPTRRDVLGYLRRWDAGVLTIERTNGALVEVAESDLLAGKVIGPPPERSGGGVRLPGTPRSRRVEVHEDVGNGGNSPRQRVARDTHPRERARLAKEERASPECDPLVVQATIWLFRAYGAVGNAQAAALRGFGLSPSAFNVLMALANTPGETLEPFNIAERLLVSRPSVTGLLDTLERKGLIERHPHAEDRRRVLVRLTDEGRRLLGEAIAPVHRTLNEAFGKIDEDGLDDLVVLLRNVDGATPAELHTT